MSSEKLKEELLREASAFGDEEGVQALIDVGVDINSQHAINGWTGLHWAAKRGHTPIVRLLLSHGADPTLTSLYGESPLALANKEEIRTLLLAGNPDSTTKFQEKPPLPITPNYLANAPVAPKVEKCDVRNSEPLVSSVAIVDNESKRKFEEELVLKIRVANSDEQDFIEIEIPVKELSYETVFKMCCNELDISPRNVLKLRKLPNTIVRKDKDVLRFQNFQELELVLNYSSANVNSQRSNNINQESKPINNNDNSAVSSPLVKKSNYCKNGTILY